MAALIKAGRISAFLSQHIFGDVRFFDVNMFSFVSKYGLSLCSYGHFPIASCNNVSNFILFFTIFTTRVSVRSPLHAPPEKRR